jgi:hypothetical protein
MSRQARTMDQPKANNTLNVATIVEYLYDQNGVRLESFRLSIWEMRIWKSCESPSLRVHAH